MEELGIVPRAYTVISCPTCGRCVMDIPAMAEKTDRMLGRVAARYRRRGRPVERVGGITVAVMGCNVNGPGEARAADVGIAGGKGSTGTLFRGGRPVETLPERRLLPALKRQATRIIEEKLGREAGFPG
jgi:(E)-4-hydroxy-3-methylbut-2-enyl-diphosphate synthase